MKLLEWSSRAAIGLAIVLGPSLASAQPMLSLSQAIDQALERPLLKAEAERVAAAQARVHQAGLWQNPEFQFTNENLRPGQSYRDRSVRRSDRRNSAAWERIGFRGFTAACVMATGVALLVRQRQQQAGSDNSLEKG